MDVDVENQYYGAKSSLDDGELATALAAFEAVLASAAEGDDSDGLWAFRSWKQIVKVHVARQKEDDALAALKHMIRAGKEGGGEQMGRAKG